jgi:hypothetical protein
MTARKLLKRLWKTLVNVGDTLLRVVALVVPPV